MICHIWINTQDLTNNITPYYPIFQEVVKDIPLMILRNQYDANAGIYLVGIEEGIKKLSKTLTEIIATIEYGINTMEYSDQEGRIYQRVKLRSKLINRVLLELRTTAKSRGLTKEDWLAIQSQLILCRTYISETNSLKILKAFK